MEELDSKIRTGVAWSSVTLIGAQLAYFVTSVILTRLLSPQDFGLVVMIIVFTGFATMFTDMGFGAAIYWILLRSFRLDAYGTVSKLIGLYARDLKVR